MSERPDRPDPDALLRRVQRDEARARRGQLKIFFGFAPGVGKTYRMLQVARDLVSDRQVDAVIGVVETHGRFETSALVLGLDLVPRRRVAYRGRELEELDLDAILARRPELALVDELAHSNPPGSRHPKRWQDVEELLAAGVDVFTTLNVQHVESLNDVVAQITGVQVRETVPDSVVDGASSIELVDVAPEELLARLKAGKVYLGEQARRAAGHFFQRGNLLALRELALRRTAQHVDEDVRHYRELHGVAATWAVGERILVCVSSSPSSERLIRGAARMAAGLRCPWVAAYVDSAALGADGAKPRERLESHLRLAEALGGAVARLTGTSVAEAVLRYARRHNVTRIVIGKPTHARLWDRLRGSLLDEVVRGSGDIDVHVIRGDDGQPRADGAARASRRSTPWSQWLFATGLVGAALVAALVLRAGLALPDPEMLFLLAVMVAAARVDRGPALLAAALGVAAYDFFFVPPFHTFSVDDRRYLLTFVVMFGVSGVISELAGRLRRQEREALAREARTATLYALTRDLASTADTQGIAAAAVRHAAEVLAAPAIVLHAGEGGRLVPIGAWPADARIDDAEQGVARWAHEHGALAGAGTDALPGSNVVCAPLRVAGSSLGVLAIRPPRPGPLTNEQRSFIDVFGRQVAAALERARLAEEARAAALRAKTEELRSSLLSTVSHDLRTPLASITGAATVLRDAVSLDAATRGELLQSIVEQAERLERLVRNLLDMTRLEGRGVALHRDWVPLEEIVGSALTRLELRLAERPVHVRLPDELLLIDVDPVLMEQLFVNLLENADKYAPPGTPLEIEARAASDGVEVDVVDHGPGIPADELERVFEKFYRGAGHGAVPGAGLGLPICRAIAEAHGGTLHALAAGDGGAVLRLRLPARGDAPSAPSAMLSDAPAEDQRGATEPRPVADTAAGPEAS